MQAETLVAAPLPSRRRRTAPPRLTPEAVADIRARRASWVGRLAPTAAHPDSLATIAGEYGVSLSLISKVVHQRIYKMPYGAGGSL
jgi:hypothetical protein